MDPFGFLAVVDTHNSWWEFYTISEHLAPLETPIKLLSFSFSDAIANRERKLKFLKKIIAHLIFHGSPTFFNGNCTNQSQGPGQTDAGNKGKSSMRQ
jgi:hypothetical protein